MEALLAQQCWRGWLKRGELDCFLPPPCIIQLSFPPVSGSVPVYAGGALVRYGVRVTQPRKAMRQGNSVFSRRSFFTLRGLGSISLCYVLIPVYDVSKGSFLFFSFIKFPFYYSLWDLCVHVCLLAC